jgi:ParB/RepB/Spo0J family partition protein
MTTATAPKVSKISIKQISLTNNHREADLRTDKDIEALANSMEQYGLLQPIQVRKTGNKTKPYQLVFGAGRLAAAKSLEWKTIPAIVVEIEDDEAEAHRTVENTQRLALNPVEEANAVSLMLKKYDGDVTAVAQALSVTEKWINDRTYFYYLCDAVRNLVKANRLNVQQAKLLARVRDPQKQESMALFHSRDDDGLGGRSLDQLRRDVENELYSLRSVPWNLDAEDMGKDLPRCDTCEHNSANDLTLFTARDGNEKTQSKIEAGCCSNQGCFAKKMTLANKHIEKLTEKAVQLTKASKAGKPIELKAPGWMRVSRIKTITRKAEQGDQPAKSAKTPDHDAYNSKAYAEYQKAREKWHEEVHKIIEESGIADDHYFMAQLLLCDRLNDMNRGDEDWLDRLSNTAPKKTLMQIIDDLPTGAEAIADFLGWQSSQLVVELFEPFGVEFPERPLSPSEQAQQEDAA